MLAIPDEERTVAGTRTWLTTPVGHAPEEESAAAEHWVPGPRLPTEPRPPSRFRGAIVLGAVLAAVVGLTFLLAPVFVEGQDPTFGDEQPQRRLDDTGDFDPTFERQTG